jgi:two-component system chemotaxis response regulator CheY
MKVLVVDDCPTMIGIIKGLLVTLGHSDIDIATSGQQALKRIRQKRYDIVFTDWNMPGMSGIEMVEIIRGDEKTKDQVIIMVSAETSKKQIHQVEQYVIDDFIAKPLNRKTLQEKIIKAIAKKSEARAELITLCHERIKQRLKDRVAREEASNRVKELEAKQKKAKLRTNNPAPAAQPTDAKNAVSSSTVSPTLAPETLSPEAIAQEKEREQNRLKGLAEAREIEQQDAAADEKAMQDALKNIKL